MPVSQSKPQFPVRAAWIVRARVTVTASVSGPSAWTGVSVSQSQPQFPVRAAWIVRLRVTPCHSHSLSFRSVLLGL